jgi:hypothetical protein
MGNLLYIRRMGTALLMLRIASNRLATVLYRMFGAGCRGVQHLPVR